MTYNEAYDKIIQAYFKDEIKPYDGNFCFCGTLANGCIWYYDESEYSRVEYNRMERALLQTINECFFDIDRLDLNWHGKKEHNQWEDFLYLAMCSALEVLKQIHIEHGEVIEEDIPVFTQRKKAIAQ